MCLVFFVSLCVTISLLVWSRESRFRLLFQERRLSRGWGRSRGSTVFNPDQVKSCGGGGAVGFGFSAGGEQVGNPVDIRSAGRDSDNGPGQHSDHPIQKAASFELENNQFLAVLKADLVNGPGGGDCCLTAIRGKRGKVVGAGQMVSGGAQEIEVELIRHMPGSADF